MKFIQSNENKTIDLSGDWIQKGKESEEDFLAGYIKDNRIEVFWMSEGGKSSSIYWSVHMKNQKKMKKGIIGSLSMIKLERIKVYYHQAMRL